MKPDRDAVRLIGMTLLDDRSDLAHDDSARPAVRRPSRRALLAVFASLLLLLVALAIAIGGGSSSTRSPASAPLSNRTGAGLAPEGGALETGGGGTPGSAVGSADSATASAPVPVTAGGKAATGAQQSAPNAPSTPADPVTKVVKTGEIDLQVDKHQVPHTIDKLIALAKLENGFVSDSHSSDGEAPSGSVTLRVPVQSFEATLTEVRTHIAGKVLEQQTAGEDVTSKYVDLQARLHSLSTTRATYERLLTHADTIGDILAVQSRISDLQTQIEQLQGQLRVLNNQTTYGTLTVTVAEKGNTPKPAAVHHRSGMSKAFHRSLDRFVNGIEAIVGIIGPLLLVALLAGLGYLVFRALYRRFASSAAGARGAGAVGDDRLVGEQ